MCRDVYYTARLETWRKQPNDQAHPPPEAEATGGTTKAQAVGGRVQRLVVLVLARRIDLFAGVARARTLNRAESHHAHFDGQGCACFAENERQSVRSEYRQSRAGNSRKHTPKHLQRIGREPTAALRKV